MSTKAMMGVAIALAAMLASPAFAVEREQARHHAPNPASDGAYARQIQPFEQELTHRPHSPNPAWDVYGTAGQYIGSDPDPFIRDMLARDPSEGGMER